MITRRKTLMGAAAVLCSPRFVSADEATPQMGIILVGSSWCPYCHHAAKNLHTAAQQWGWPVLIASLDGQPIPPFADFIDSRDHPLTKGVTRLPTTLIVIPKEDQIVEAFEGFKGGAQYLTRISQIMAFQQTGEDNV